MYLLDTNVCIDFLIRPTNQLIARLDQNFCSLSVSMITVAELRVGKQTSTDPKADDDRLNIFLDGVGVRNFDEAAAVEYGKLVRSVGMNRKSFDRLIAAHALALGFVLVTSNVKHFADVPGLVVEDWMV